MQGSRRAASIAGLVALALVVGGCSGQQDGGENARTPAQGAQQQPQMPGALRGGYQVIRVDAPEPEAGLNFGIELVATDDVNGDGAADLLAPQSGGGRPVGDEGGEGVLYVLDGRTGRPIDRVAAPDGGGESDPAGFGTFVNRIPDIGSCQGGRSGELCPAEEVGRRDGVPDIAVGATGIDVGGEADVGRAYVLDGATRALLKRIDMPPSQRRSKASFARTVLAPIGLPPCLGNLGLGGCQRVPAAVRVGDMSGDRQTTPDLVIGAPGFRETNDTNAACPEGETCARAGRVYVYYGEDIAGSDPDEIENTPDLTVRNPRAQADSAKTVNTNTELLGQAVVPIGDIGGDCQASRPEGARPYVCPPDDSTNTPDGRPDVVLSAFRTDVADMPDAGVNLLVDGRTGAVVHTYTHPEPQPYSIFGFTLHGDPVAGDMGGSGAPDVFMAAIRQNDEFLADGKGYVMNGDFKTSPNSINFSLLTDPTPHNNENFGASYAGVGDLVPGAQSPGNELLVGAFGPHNPGTDKRVVNDIHIFNPVTARSLKDITAPDRQPGSAFGSSVQPLGDVNGDGRLDIAAGAPLFDGDAGADQGRVYLLLSQG